jgi:hypothetical protein
MHCVKRFNAKVAMWDVATKWNYEQNPANRHYDRRFSDFVPAILWLPVRWLGSGALRNAL